MNLGKKKIELYPETFYFEFFIKKFKTLLEKVTKDVKYKTPKIVYILFKINIRTTLVYTCVLCMYPNPKR